jgi:hypothetical protein
LVPVSAGVFGIVAFLMGSFFVAAGAVFGFRWGNFFEKIEEDEPPIPAFDLNRFIVEPLYLLAAVAAVFVATGVGMLIRSLWSR